MQAPFQSMVLVKAILQRRLVVRQSGFGGKDNGLEAFEQYTQTKVIWFIHQ